LLTGIFGAIKVVACLVFVVFSAPPANKGRLPKRSDKNTTKTKQATTLIAPKIPVKMGIAGGLFLAQQSTGSTALAYFGPQFFELLVGDANKGRLPKRSDKNTTKTKQATTLIAPKIPVNKRVRSPGGLYDCHCGGRENLPSAW
jgi:hypothetical protein